MAETTTTKPTNFDDIDDHPMFRKKLLDKLKSPEQLDTLLTVTSSRTWLVLVALGLLLAAALVWSIVGTLETTVAGSGVIVPAADGSGGLEAVFYTTVRDGHRIQPGKTVKIAPASIRQEEYGLLVGTVTRVNPTPSTGAEMLAVLGNDALMQSLAGSGLIMAVHVALESAETPSGYRWTTAGGPPTPIRPGVVAEAQIVVNEQRPIALVLPR